MEQATNEQQTKEAIATSEEQAVQGQSIPVKKTEEEKILEIATNIVFQVISKAPKPLTLQEQEDLLERTKRQVSVERAQALEVLNEAEMEIPTLKFTNLLSRSFADQRLTRTTFGRSQKTFNGSHGFRGLFYISFGNFVMSKKGGWIYRPTQQQHLHEVKRFNKKGICEREATQLRKLLQPVKVAKSEGVVEEESPKMKELKQDLLDQVRELKEIL